MMKNKTIIRLFTMTFIPVALCITILATSTDSKAAMKWYKVSGKWVKFNKSTGELGKAYDLSYVPKKVAGKKVKIIGSRCFGGNKKIKTANIPSSVKKIKSRAFVECTNLKKVIFPKGIKSLDVMKDKTFWGCNKLKTVKNNPDKKWVTRIKSFNDLLGYLKNKDPKYYVENVRTFKNQWVLVEATGEKPKYTDDQWAVVVNKAKELTNGCKTNMEKAKKISKWISSYLVYDEDWMKEYKKWRDEHNGNTDDFPLIKYTDAYHLITWKKSEHMNKSPMTTCGGYANLTQALFCAADIPCLVIQRVMKKELGEDIDHVFNAAYIGDKWIWIDNDYTDKNLSFFNCEIAGFSASDHRCDRLHVEYISDLIDAENNKSEYVRLNGMNWGIKRDQNEISFIPRQFTGPEIPSEIDGMKVTSIGEYACQNRNNITSLIIPEGVTQVKKGAFQGCKRIETITLPKTLKTLCDYSFRNCDSLETVNYLGGEKKRQARVLCF